MIYGVEQKNPVRDRRREAQPKRRWHDGDKPARPRPRILIVDDEAHDREIYGRMLCYNGFDVVFAGSGAEALTALQEHDMDLVVLDLGLPDMPGLVALQRWRSDAQLRNLPVIAVSGFSYDQMAELARQAGCWRYIEKPASPVAVMHAVEDIVGRPPLAGVGRAPEIIDLTTRAKTAHSE